VTSVSLAVPARAETLNSVVASVGDAAITQRDVIEEYRFELFLEGKAPAGAPHPEERQGVLSRLISQRLLAEQMQRPGRPSKNGANNAEDTLKSVREKFPDQAAYRAALQSLGMTEPQVLKRLEIYERTLQMINNRLRPAALPDPSEVEDYYKNTFVPEYAKEHAGPPPPLDNIRAQIREILVQKRMNELLDSWLDRLKSTHRVTIHTD
jgi:peptidyl-prolyl cis-trans isomerase SurA